MRRYDDGRVTTWLRCGAPCLAVLRSHQERQAV